MKRKATQTNVKFKKGDRVAVYDGAARLTGVVAEGGGALSDGTPVVSVSLAPSGVTIWFHPNQCRKLKPKPPAPKWEPVCVVPRYGEESPSLSLRNCFYSTLESAEKDAVKARAEVTGYYEVAVRRLR